MMTATLQRKEKTDAGQSAPRRILFICTGNTCRSPMAAAALYDFARQNGVEPLFCAESAGLFPSEGAPISENAAKALRNAGILPLPLHNYEAHRARPVTKELMESADEVIALTGAHAMQLFLRFPEQAQKISQLDAEIKDPYGGDLQEYEACLAQIRDCLARRFF